MPIAVQRVAYKGWDQNFRLSNGVVDMVVTAEVGPRIIRFGFCGERNLFAEMPDQLGRTGEKSWMIRGGHRLWIAPEQKPVTYELDNGPVVVRRTREGVRTIQPVGDLSGIQRLMDIQMASRGPEVRIVHTLVNRSRRTVVAAPWALTVMAKGGTAVIPLPKKIPHTRRLTHNQSWSIWPYTDFADGRWTLGSRYVLFRQDSRRGPGKLGVAHRMGWAAYVLPPYLFVKRFQWIEGATYPDGGVNFETFSNEHFLEMESLGPLMALKPGRAARHVEVWRLAKGIRPVKTEADADRQVLPHI